MNDPSSSTRPPFDPAKLHFEFPLPNREHRFSQLILFIAERCKSDPTFSAIKLNKILFYSDFEAYARLGTPITGVAYQKLRYGPAAKAMPRILDEMQQDKLIRIVRQTVRGAAARELVVPIRPPANPIFDREQIDIVEQYIRLFWKQSATWVSKYSHGMAWKLAQLNELIPYDAVFISDAPITQAEVDHVKKLATEYGWNL
jgi:hypothetical protein